jgi:hypothetical protein
MLRYWPGCNRRMTRIADMAMRYFASMLLGDGLRLFEHGAPLTLERTRVLESPGVTHQRFRVDK